MRRAAWKHGKNRKPMKRTAPMKRGGKIKPKARSAGEFARVYGSRARVAWIKGLACIACDAISPAFGLVTRGKCENAHTVTGGMGRKSDHTTIVPLCPVHHRRYDQHQAPFDTDDTREATKAAARILAAAWDQMEGAA